MTARIAGDGPGQRHLNGLQTTGRDYRDLSEPIFTVHRTDNVAIQVRDGTELLADLFRPDSEGRFPALLSFSPYLRQIQDVGAPLGFIEAGASDFFVPRGYVHVIVNARGTSGSGGIWTFLDTQEREDLFDLIEWIATQPWCDGNVGMLGISYFAMAQLAAAVTRPPHLKAIAPMLTTDDLYGAVWHNGLLNAGFISAWLPAVGVMSQRPDSFWRSWRIDLARDLLMLPAVHARMQHLNGEAIVTVLKHLIHSHYPEHPFGEIWRRVAIEHPLRDEFWEARDVRPLLGAVDIPVYLGADWDNVPLHLPATFTSWAALRHNPKVRMALLPPGGFSWPWEALHYEVLAWYDHWLKGRDTGVMDGPPIRYLRTRRGWLAQLARLATAGGDADALRVARGRKARFRRRATRLPGLSLCPTGLWRAGQRQSPELSDRLVWETAPFDTPFTVAGNIELALEAKITALDTSWIAVLYDVSPDGEAEAVTAGWLRASLSLVNQEQSTPSAPVLDCRTTIAIPAGEPRLYRMPIVPNARHVATGHRLRLVIASSDETDKSPTILGFIHVALREASLNTIFSNSRLWLPVLSADGAA